MAAKQRKRDAVGNLRDLAEEIGLPTEARRKADLTETDFLEFHTRVVNHTTTPEHRQRCADALQMFKGNSQLPQLPTVPALPGNRGRGWKQGRGRKRGRAQERNRRRGRI